jgi:hypothetical protein
VIRALRSVDQLGSPIDREHEAVGLDRQAALMMQALPGRTCRHLSKMRASAARSLMFIDAQARCR